MTIDNEELMQKFVRTGMIMRHIDGEGPCCHKHGHGHGHGHGAEDHEEARMARSEMGEEAERPIGPHGHGPSGRMDDASECHGHGHGHGGHGHGGHGHGPGCYHGKGHGKGKRHGQARALTMISMQEGITQKDLAFLLGVRPQSAGEMLARLEEHGLIERRKSEADARAIELYLTDDGRARASEIAERRKLAAADLFATLTDEEKDQLAAILDKLGAELDKHRPHGHSRSHGGDEPTKA